MWISKIGATANVLLLGLSNNGELVTFSDLSEPTLRLRRKTSPQAEALEFTVSEYTGEDTRFNAQVEFTDWSSLQAGDYIAEVDATLSGNAVSFPSDGYIPIRFLRGIE